MSQKRIETALFAHLANLSTALPIIYPTTRHKPKDRGYIRATVTYDGDPTYATDRALFSGILSLNVFWPEGQDNLAKEEADCVTAHFQRGTEITNDGAVVQVHRSPFYTQPLDEPGWVNVPVIVPWRSKVAETIS